MARIPDSSVRGKLEEMLYELRAINTWNRAYAAKRDHNLIETSANEARRRRTGELLAEFLELTVQARS